MRNYRAVLSTGFITGLFLLLVNDFFLKQVFHNAFTGKLSDFAGLFIFPIFWSVFFPACTQWIYLLTGLFFIYWKLPLSENFIHWINGWMPIHLHRTVDPTDLLALLVLPFSYQYFSQENIRLVPLKPVWIVSLSAFAFVATSYDNRIRIEAEKTWTFDFSKDQLKIKLAANPDLEYNYAQEVESVLKDPEQLKWYRVSTSDSVLMRKEILLQLLRDTMELHFAHKEQNIRYDVYLQMSEKGDRSVLHVRDFHVVKEEKEKGDEEKYNKQVPVLFEEKVIARLRAGEKK